MNVAALLERAGRSEAARPAVALGAEVLLTYGGLLARVRRLAGGLRRDLRLQVGARVALAMRNHPAYVELLFASWQAGLAVVPINYKLHAREFRTILEDSGAAVAFVTPDLAETIAEASRDLASPPRRIDVESAAYESLWNGPELERHPARPGDLAWLFYTSGTTGAPKGAMLTHRSLLAMTLAFLSDVDAVAPGEHLIHAAPMSHGSGLYILPYITAAACQVVPESGGFDPEELLGLIARCPGSGFFAAPTMVKRFVEHPATGGADLRNLKTLVYGGGPMYLADLKRGLEVLGPVFVQIYGQGESPMTITCLPRRDLAEKGHPDWEARLASVGRAQPCVEVIVADPDSGQPLPVGETGEVLVRGDSLMAGYWNRPEATAKALAEGWLHTGDMGVLDAAGYLTLKDRSKDVVISGGSNIYPREVEEALLTHPGVAEVAVVGRPHPDWGEELVAFVVARRPGLEAAVLEAHCLERIARFKRPRVWRFVEALPKNSYGKVLKTDLRRLA